MGTWDAQTLYENHCIFGIGMSGWKQQDWWEHKEDQDIELFKKYARSSDFTHAIELLPIWW